MKIKNLKKSNKRLMPTQFQILKLCSKKKLSNSKTSVKLTELLLNKSILLKLSSINIIIYIIYLFIEIIFY